MCILLFDLFTKKSSGRTGHAKLLKHMTPTMLPLHLMPTPSLHQSSISLRADTLPPPLYLKRHQQGVPALHDKGQVVDHALQRDAFINHHRPHSSQVHKLR